MQSICDACNKPVEESEAINCPVCASKTYCSDECRAQSWVNHMNTECNYFVVKDKQNFCVLAPLSQQEDAEGNIKDIGYILHEEGENPAAVKPVFLSELIGGNVDDPAVDVPYRLGGDPFKLRGTPLFKGLGYGDPRTDNHDKWTTQVRAFDRRNPILQNPPRFGKRSTFMKNVKLYAAGGPDLVTNQQGKRKEINKPFYFEEMNADWRTRLITVGVDTKGMAVNDVPAATALIGIQTRRKKMEQGTDVYTMLANDLVLNDLGKREFSTLYGYINLSFLVNGRVATANMVYNNTMLSFNQGFNPFTKQLLKDWGLAGKVNRKRVGILHGMTSNGMHVYMAIRFNNKRTKFNIITLEVHIKDTPNTWLDYERNKGKDSITAVRKTIRLNMTQVESVNAAINNLTLDIARMEGLVELLENQKDSDYDMELQKLRQEVNSVKISRSVLQQYTESLASKEKGVVPDISEKQIANSVASRFAVQPWAGEDVSLYKSFKSIADPSERYEAVVSEFQRVKALKQPVEKVRGSVALNYAISRLRSNRKLYKERQEPLISLQASLRSNIDSYHL